MNKRSPHLLVQDIIDSCNKIMRYTQDLSYEEFEAGNLTLDAVLRNFTIIVQATSMIPEEEKNKYSEVDWEEVTNIQNITNVDYEDIDIHAVWRLKQNTVPKLLGQMVEINNMS